ncbi:hypothetical protein F5148DRAFT_301143 [Russula earlei]|uniref:Uncharacterized protein n=1 Tax=Russula earlei TaxID=71964 RepID=A0ACC0UKJ1_9AGAM|nr:hypothetical protein F5148DRAFT_301143 [Russula earlei]
MPFSALPLASPRRSCFTRVLLGMPSSSTYLQSCMLDVDLPCRVELGRRGPPYPSYYYPQPPPRVVHHYVGAPPVHYVTPQRVMVHRQPTYRDPRDPRQTTSRNNQQTTSRDNQQTTSRNNQQTTSRNNQQTTSRNNQQTTPKGIPAVDEYVDRLGGIEWGRRSPPPPPPPKPPSRLKRFKQNCGRRVNAITWADSD